jgi:hypothetical protein
VTDDPALVTSPDVNWGAFLEQAVREYNTDPALGVAHGLQKEAIQNSHGARDRQSKVPWSCAFRLLESPNGLLLSITDEGTCGLTGTTTPNAKDRPDSFPASERLARFESMFDSGGDEGPGLFGRGKLIFNACSEERLIFYDSLTRDGKYRFGKRHIRGRVCEQYLRAFEGEAARTRLREELGASLQPLSTPGTRITIVRPTAEILDAIQSGEFLTAIGDTWWEIIQKENAEITVSGKNGTVTHAIVPENFGGLPKVSRNKWRVYRTDNTTVDVGGAKYKIKHLHILIPPQGHKLREEQLGIFVQRRGMQVGRLPVAGTPEEVADRLFGYVQLDEAFEDVLAASENLTHYGFSHTKRPEFRALRKWVQEHFNTFMDSIGLGRKTDQNARARESAEEANAALNGILKDLGVPSLGTGRESRRDFSLSIENLEFGQGNNLVKTGETLAGFLFRIANHTSGQKDVMVEVTTNREDGSVIETILPKVMMRLHPGQSKPTDALRIHFAEGTYASGEKVSCTAAVSGLDGQVLARRSFFVFVDTPPPPPAPELAEIELTEYEFPKEDSKRVNFGQSILGLAYTLNNKTPQRMSARVRIMTIWAEEGVELDEVFNQDLVLSPYGSVDCHVEEIKVTEERYGEVKRGKVKLRCTATGLESTNLWERGRRLAEKTTMFYLEMDPSYGLFEDMALVPMAPGEPRSKASPTAGTKSWKLDINSNHPAFVHADPDDEARVEYIFEESARQAAFVLLSRDQGPVLLKILGLDSRTKIDEMDPEGILRSLAYPFTDRILAKYYG